ncbi:MAG TPA: phosphotransferase [Candidatus Saccharimonadales bacterium]|nr:phosphotransferase [Candidatus Saccharimonadales bacterium]
MKRILRLLSDTKQLFIDDSLFRNAALLVASTAVMSVLGFGFWLFVAHLYSPSEIGVASALISVTTLISNISLLGLNAGLVRFLPGSNNQSRDINAAIVTVGLVTMLITAAYLLIGGMFGVHLSLLSETWHKAAFVILMATVSLNMLTDAVFVANRRAEYHTAVYAVFGSIKLVLPIFLIPLGSLGIFLAYMLAVIVSLVLSLAFMKRVAGYRLFARPDWRLLQRTRKFATNNYIGVIVAGLPAQIMPLLIIRDIGSAAAAFFSMAWTMANLLYVVPSAATQSLLAESSHDPQQKSTNVRRTVKLLGVILLPAVALAVLVAPYLLRIFGEQYATGSTTIFQLLAVSTIFIAINTVRNTSLNIEHRSSGIVLAQASATVVTLGSAPLLLRFGLRGVGVAMLLGMVASNICHYFIYRYNKHHPKALPTDADTSSQLALQSVASEFALTHHNLGQLLQAYGIHTFVYKELGNGSSSRTILIKQQEQLNVLRIYAEGKAAGGLIQEEIRFTAYLASQGVPVPRMLPNNQGELMSEAMIDNKRLHYVLMEFEPGKHPARYTAPIIYDMAKNQASIHVYGQHYAAEPLPKANVRKRAHRRSWLESMPPIRFAPRGFSHFDYDASNILADDRRVMCILDFEGMRHGPLVACMFFTLAQMYDSQPDIANLQLYITAYQQIRILNRLEKWLLRGALLLHCKKPQLLFVHI